MKPNQTNCVSSLQWQRKCSETKETPEKHYRLALIYFDIILIIELGFLSHFQRPKEKGKLYLPIYTQFISCKELHWPCLMAYFIYLLSATTKPHWTGTSTMPIVMSNTKNEERNNSIPLEALIAFSAFPVACAVWLVCYFKQNSAPWRNPSELTEVIVGTLFLFQEQEFFN